MLNKKHTRLIGLLIIITGVILLITSCNFTDYCNNIYGTTEDCPFIFGKIELSYKNDSNEKIIIKNNDGMYDFGGLATTRTGNTTPVTKEFKITNTGTGDLEIAQITASFTSVFMIDTSNTQMIIPPNNSTTFKISFLPEYKDRITESITIEKTIPVDAQPEENDNFYFNVAGEGYEPYMKVTDNNNNQIDPCCNEPVIIGEAMVDSGPVTNTFTIENIGNLDLEVSSISLATGYFTKDLTNFTLTPGETKTLTIEFKPITLSTPTLTQDGKFILYEDYLIIKSNDIDYPQYDIPIQGHGKDHNLAFFDTNDDDELVRAVLPSNAIAIDRKYQYEFEIQNTGNTPITESFTIVPIASTDTTYDDNDPIIGDPIEYTITDEWDYIQGGDRRYFSDYFKFDPAFTPGDTYYLGCYIDRDNKIIETDDTIGNNAYLNDTQITLEEMGIVYVHATDGDDTNNNGSPDFPYLTINKAIEKLGDNFSTIKEVRVAQGTYEVNSSLADTDYSSSILLTEDNISVFGGYNDDFTERDPYTYTTTIVDTNPSIGGSYGTDLEVKAPVVFNGTAAAAISRFTYFDGFDIYAPNVDYSAGIEIKGESNPTISNNSIIGSDTNSANSYCVVILGSSKPMLQWNTIYAGGNSGTTNKATGIFIDNTITTSLNTEIIENTILSGNTNTFYGISVKGTASHNIINTTISEDSPTTTFYGIYSTMAHTGSINTDEKIIVDNCTITGGSGNSSIGILATMSSGTTTHMIVNHSTISGGTATTSTGIKKDSNGQILVTRSTVYGSSESSATDTSKAVEVTNTPTTGTTVLVNNYLHGGFANGNGTNRSSTGFSSDSTTPYYLINNIIHGGESATTKGISVIDAVGSSIVNNTIYIGDGTDDAYGINPSDTPTFPIKNNIIFSTGETTPANGSFGIKDPIGSTPNANITNNNIFITGTDSGNNYVDGTNNIRAYPFFQSLESGNEDLHLTSYTPKTISEGGISNQSDLGIDGLTILGFIGMTQPMDINGNERTGNGTMGWSMGAYEWDNGNDTHHIFVSNSGSDTTGNGSPEKPYATIQTAINDAPLSGMTDTSYPDSHVIIPVEQGTYDITETIGITDPKILLSGGHTSSDWQNSDPDAYPTIINNITTQSSETTSVEFMNVDSTHNGIKGFTFTSNGNLTDPVSGVVKLTNSSAMIAYCNINFNNSSSDDISGIYIDNSSGTITNPIYIFNNDIDVTSNSAQYSKGLYISDAIADVNIFNNTINGGTSDYTHGIHITGSTAYIFNNTIDGGSGATVARGIYFDNDNANAEHVYNNIIYTSSSLDDPDNVAVYDNKTGELTAFTNNNIYGLNTSNLYYDVESDTLYTDIETLLNSTAYTNIISVDPAFAGGNDYHLTTGSPVDVRGGGIDISLEVDYIEPIIYDKDGIERTYHYDESNGSSTIGEGWSMGAYEHD